MIRKNESKITLRILALLLALLTLLPLAACGPKPEPAPETSIVTTAPQTTEATTEAQPKYEIRLNAPASTEIHTKLQKTYLAQADPHKILEYADNGGTIELGRPNPITLTWTVSDTAAGHISAITLRIGTKADGSDAKEIAIGADQTEYAFYNAFIGQKYYWSVTMLDDEGNTTDSSVASFQTAAQAPRNLYVDGITNVRDLGGWFTLDGGKVRQGLLYRGARLNDNDSTDILITEEGARTLRDEIGIKTEIDLRQTNAVNGRDESGGITVSPLGESVTYLACPMYYGDKLISDTKNKQRVKEIFAILADESNYPIYIHCSIGTDRTGLIVWLVNGLCGVVEKNLWRDYLFSNFGTIGGTRTREKNEDVYVNKIKAKSGVNLAEQTYNFLKDYFEIPESDLQAVIRIMKEAPAN